MKDEEDIYIYISYIYIYIYKWMDGWIDGCYHVFTHSPVRCVL